MCGCCFRVCLQRVRIFQTTSNGCRILPLWSTASTPSCRTNSKGGKNNWCFLFNGGVIFRDWKFSCVPVSRFGHCGCSIPKWDAVAVGCTSSTQIRLLRLLVSEREPSTNGLWLRFRHDQWKHSDPCWIHVALPYPELCLTEVYQTKQTLKYLVLSVSEFLLFSIVIQCKKIIFEPSMWIYIIQSAISSSKKRVA